jgi:hypothetical protein
MPAPLLKIKRFIDNDVWKIVFALDTTVLPEADKELMRKFGEPQINIGGTYASEPAGAWSYTLPDKFIRIRTDLPFTKEFDAKSPDFEEFTNDKAIAFQTRFVADFTAAVLELRANADTFTGEFIENI